MATGKKTGGKDFVKGQGKIPGAGRPELTDEQREIKKQLKKYSGKLMLAKYLLMPHQEFENINEDELPVVEYFSVKLLSKAMRNCDFQIYQYFFGRVFGEVGKDVNVNVKSNSFYKDIMSEIHGKDFSNDEE